MSSDEEYLFPGSTTNEEHAEYAFYDDDEKMTMISNNNLFELGSSVSSDSSVSSSDSNVSSDSNGNDEDVYGFQGLNEEGVKYVYRVCRPDEDIGEAIVCRDENSDRSVSQHVTSGTRHPSRFISTTSSPIVALLWAFYEMNVSSRPRRQQNLRIVRISLDAVSEIPDLAKGCINLNNRKVREHLIPAATARNFAISSNEVLFIGLIPKFCYNIVVNPKCPPDPSEQRLTNYKKNVDGKFMKKLKI